MKNQHLPNSPNTLPLTRLKRAIEQFRTVDEHASLTLFQSFLYIALNDGQEMKQEDLAVELGRVRPGRKPIAAPVASNQVGRLGDAPMHGGKGLDLIRTERHGRENHLSLTVKGQRLADRLRDALLGEGR